MAKCFFYFDKYGIGHATKDQKGAERFAGPGTEIKEYDGECGGGYPLTKSGYAVVYEGPTKLGPYVYPYTGGIGGGKSYANQSSAVRAEVKELLGKVGITL
jgi:hypothetical protein